jgi:hypothetical protein
LQCEFNRSRASGGVASSDGGAHFKPSLGIFLLFFEVSPEVDGRDLGGSINIIIFRGGLDLIRKAVTGCSVVKPAAGEFLVVLFSWLTIGFGAGFGADFGIDESITDVE